MPELKVRNMENQEVGSIGLTDEVFDAPLKEHLIYQAVHHHMASQRSGTASTKTRGEVSGSGRKLWRQKKTGRARIGSIRSPIWRSGGIVHGPKPRDYSYHLPRKMRAGALRSMLSQRHREGRLIVVDALEMTAPKTQDLIAILAKLGLTGHSALLVCEGEGRNLTLSARNLQHVKAMPLSGLNIYEVLAHEYLVMSQSVAQQLMERLSR